MSEHQNLDKPIIPPQVRRKKTRSYTPDTEDVENYLVMYYMHDII